MSFIFSMVRFFPYWALPIVLVLGETALFAKRRNRTKLMYGCIAFVLIFVLVIVAWFFFRGDLHSDDWVKGFIGEPEG